MSTITVAKKEFQDGIRSRVLLGLVVLFAVFMAGAVYFFTQIAPPGAAGSGDTVPSAVVIDSLLTPTYILMPLIGTMLGYKSISGERESGSLKFLLSLPHSRQDVVCGKLIGRSGIVTIAVLIGFSVGGLALFVLTDSFKFGNYAALVGVSMLLATVFVSIAMAFSSAVRSSTIATAGAITLVLVFLFLWQVVLALVRYVAIELSLITASWSQPGDWFMFLQLLNPTTAFTAVVHTLSDGAGSGPSNPPFYLEQWFGIVILGLWLVGPIGLAYLRFRDTDL